MKEEDLGTKRVELETVGTVAAWVFAALAGLPPWEAVAVVTAGSVLH